jgi:hypothetical protein
MQPILDELGIGDWQLAVVPAAMMGEFNLDPEST